MKAAKLLATALVTLMAAVPALAQMQPQGQAQQQPRGDQVDRLDNLLDLSDSQEEELRALMGEMEADIQEKQQEVRQLKRKMGEHIGPDYDEEAIREDADRLGKLTGGVMADQVLLQSKMEEIFTEEQRETLEQKMREQQRQMQQMRQQMQQRGGGGRPAPQQ